MAPGDRVAVVLDNRLETALLYWAAQWAGAVFVPLSWRLSEEELDYCIGDAGAALVIREGDPLPDGPEHAGALDRDDRGDLAPALHVRDDRAAEGGAAEPCGRPRRRPQPGAPAWLPPCRSHARRDAALPHDGDSLPARDARRRRVLRPAGPVGSRRGAPPDRAGTHHLALPRSHAVLRPPRVGRASAGTISRAFGRSATPARR